MLSDSKKIKVLLYGNVFRDYRSQILIKSLIDSGYHISLVCPDFYRSKIVRQFYLMEKVIVILPLIELFIKAAFADVIYSPPMNTRFIESAVWAAKFFNKKLVVEMYISVYDTFVRDKKILKKGEKIKEKQIKDEKSREAKAMRYKDVLALTKSDYIVHTSRHELTYWEQILDTSIDQNKVFIAPNCNVSNLSLKRFRQDGVLKICWWGTFIPLHGLDNILQAMKILQGQEVQFTCNLFGIDNSFFDTYVDKIKLNELEDCVFLRKDLSFSNGSLPEYLINNCDLALGIFGNTDKGRNGIPNKLIEALSMRIPTLTMTSPALEEFFNPETDLWTCEPAPESIAEAILKIACDAAYPVDWEQTRQKVLSTFSVARYQEVVSKVLARATEDLLR